MRDDTLCPMCGGAMPCVTPTTAKSLVGGPGDPGDQQVDVWKVFHDAGFSDLWYAHPGPGSYLSARSGPRWHAGIWTGPERDLLCVKHCNTNAEAERWLSPGGWTPEEAVLAALEKLNVSMAC